jgi:dihydrofolate synthase/folylpolyglutamate synthase
VDGRPVAAREFVRAMNLMRPHLSRLGPTFFETMTAAAFVVFARRRVDWAVIEVGLGGRLDATNVIVPAACAITPVDYDHTDKLGRTLGAIAREKAGIIKPGVPVVVGPQRPSAWAEIRRRAVRPVRARAESVVQRGFLLEFKVQGARCRLQALGKHQAHNAATAIALVEAAGVKARPAALRGVRLPGRIEVTARRPWIVVDGAHNAVSARALAEALRSLPRRRTILVFGASADKDWRAMLRALGPGADLAIFTRSSSPRAADPAELARAARGPAALVVPSVARALSAARAAAGPGDAIVVTGSIYVAGEALAAHERRD